MHKRGIELSINFIVTLILAIIILSFGIYFVKLIFEKSTELKLVLDQQTEMELERLMDSGEKVNLYPGRREVNNNELAVFGLGILNALGVDKNFKVIIKSSIGTRNDNTVICSDCNDYFELQKTFSEGIEEIKNNEKKKYLIGIIPENAEKGTYVFDVKVEYEKNGNYEIYDFKKIYVKVR